MVLTEASQEVSPSPPSWSVSASYLIRASIFAELQSLGAKFNFLFTIKGTKSRSAEMQLTTPNPLWSEVKEQASGQQIRKEVGRGKAHHLPLGLGRGRRSCSEPGRLKQVRTSEWS